MIAEKIPLLSGTYRLSIWLGDWNKDYDDKPNAVIFDFKPDRKYPHIPNFEGVGALDWVASWQSSVKSDAPKRPAADSIARVE